MQLIKEGKLQQFSNQPVVDWENECKIIDEKILSETKTIKVKKVGYLVKYPSGGKNKGTANELVSWEREHLPVTEKKEIPCPFGGMATIEPYEWEEEVIIKPHIDYPPKPKLVIGFDFNNTAEVARLINELFDFSWTWIDVPNLVGDRYEISKFTGELIAESEIQTGQRDSGRFYRYTTQTYKILILYIYSDRWEIWETSRNEVNDLDPRPEYTSGDSTSRDSDGFWNK